jgi:hypothetical protein
MGTIGSFGFRSLIEGGSHSMKHFNIPWDFMSVGRTYYKTLASILNCKAMTIIFTQFFARVDDTALSVI